MNKQNIYTFLFLKIKRLLSSTGDPSENRKILLSGKQVQIGRYTYGFERTEILSWGEDINITIGQFCSIAYGLKLYCGGNHRNDWISTFPFGHILRNYIKSEPIIGTPRSNGDIKIGNDVWIGRDVTILSGITIGDGAVIAANSHVISDVNPYTVVGGNPAKKIKQRFTDEIIERLLFIKWWDYPIETVEKIIPLLCNQNGKDISGNISQIEHLLKNIS